jgi:pSer/pThr/pTyr-binding forkhead associated (FHA) protein
MAVRITVTQRTPTDPPTGGQALVLDQEVIIIGRDPACEVVLPHPAVSRSHARIIREGTLFFVEDLGSASGTTLNATSLRRGERSLLDHGDAIAIAQFTLLFDRLAEAPQAVNESTSLLARHAVREVMRGLTPGEGPHLRIMNGPREGDRIAIGQAQELIIGREEGVHVMLEGDLVSRRHARLRRDWSGTHVEDLGSRNGVRVNRRRVAKETLADRDEIEIGNVRVLFVDPTATRSASIELLGSNDADAPTSAAMPPNGLPARAPGTHSSAGLAPRSARQNAEQQGAVVEQDPAGDEASAAAGASSDIKRFIPLAVAGVCAAVALVFLVLILAGL